MDLGKKVRRGVEDAPIVAPVFEPKRESGERLPGFQPDFTPALVPVKREVSRDYRV